MTNTGLPQTATVLEIRTHGVSGTPIDQILADPVGPLPPGDLVDVPGPLGPGRRFVRRVDGARKDVPVAGGSDSRYAWAYSWGRLTSGGFVKSLWVVLIPFALVNMAYAMISDNRRLHPARHPDSPMFTRGCRALVHLLGVALTVLFTLQITYVIVDSVGYRCIAASGGTCLEHVPYVDSLRDHPTTISVLAVTLVLVVLTVGGLITRFSATDSEGTLREIVEQSGASPAPEPGDPAMATADFVDGNIAAPVLRIVHGIAAPTAVVTLLLAMRPADTGAWRWIAPVAVFGVLASTIAAIDLCGPIRVTRWFRDHPRVHTRFSVIGWALMAGAHAGAIVVAATVLPSSFDGSVTTAPAVTLLPGGWSPIEVTIVVAATLCLLLAAALWEPSRTLDAQTRNYPKTYRPWLRGFTPAVASGLAVIIGSGFGVGASRTFNALANKDIGGADPMPTRTSYDIISTQWGLLGLLGATALVVGTLLLLAASFGPSHPAFRLNPPPDLDARNRRWQRWRTGLRYRVATLNRFTQYLLAAFLIAGIGCAAAGVWAATTDPSTHGRPGAPARPSAPEWPGAPLWLSEHWLRATGTWILIALVVGLAFVIRQAIANPDGMGRTLGVLWDVSSFWPREGHPVVPPPYAPTAVADIVDRVGEIREASPGVKIVLCGHSQGSLIMYAAALQLRRRGATDNLSLLTYGSQLQWLYGRAFPAFLNFGSHRELSESLEQRWINLIRFTDPVGGPVLSWDLTSSRAGDVSASVLDVSAETGWSRIDGLTPHDGVLAAGDERWLADPPPRIAYDFQRGHSNYMREVAWAAAIAKLTGTRTDPGSLAAD